MSENTILGRPTGASVPKDPGEPSGAPSGAREEAPQRRAAPGDASTAFHRSRVYSLLALAFDRPGASFQEAVDAGAFSSDLVESAEALGDAVAEQARSTAAAVDDADALHGAWASLFGIEEGITVSPYGLTYLPGPLVTNVRQLADLSGFYEAFGLEVAPGKNDRRDHVCFLLEFLGQLSLREAYLRTEGDEAGVDVVGDAYRQFVESHLGRWYWRFADEVRGQTSGFYADLADLLEVLLDEEVERLDVDPDPVPEDPDAAEWTEDIFGDSGRSCGGCGITPTDLEPEEPLGPDATGAPDGRADR